MELNKLVEIVKRNRKVDIVKDIFKKKSLEDDSSIISCWVILKHNGNLYDWAKGFKLEDKGDGISLMMNINTDPSLTLLKDIYANYKTKDWKSAKYGHEKTWMNLKFPYAIANENISKIINFKSTI